MRFTAAQLASCCTWVSATPWAGSARSAGSVTRPWFFFVLSGSSSRAQHGGPWQWARAGLRGGAASRMADFLWPCLPWYSASACCGAGRLGRPRCGRWPASASAGPTWPAACCSGHLERLATRQFRQHSPHPNVPYWSLRDEVEIYASARRRVGRVVGWPWRWPCWWPAPASRALFPSGVWLAALRARRRGTLPRWSRAWPCRSSWVVWPWWAASTRSGVDQAIKDTLHEHVPGFCAGRRSSASHRLRARPRRGSHPRLRLPGRPGEGLLCQAPRLAGEPGGVLVHAVSVPQADPYCIGGADGRSARVERGRPWPRLCW